MGEFDVLAVAVAVAGLLIGAAHIYRNWQLKRLKDVQVAGNRIQAEAVATMSLILSELKEIRLDLILSRKTDIEKQGKEGNP